MADVELTTQLPVGVARIINLISSVPAPALEKLLKLDDDPELQVDRFSSAFGVDADEEDADDDDNVDDTAFAWAVVRDDDDLSALYSCDWD